VEFHYGIDFNTKAIQKQSFKFEFSKKNYLEEISKARTFGLMKDIAKMREMNLIKGGDLDNAVIFDECKVINSSRLRYEDEPVRHKILDALGDLAILPHFVVGKYESFAGSHKLNHLLTKKIDEEEAFEVVDANEFKDFISFA
jgi:UDP-3-O-[3-hydroxymyristoyl] N-acetylglucosamine deacetylase